MDAGFMDKKAVRTVDFAADLVFLSILWVLCSIPIVTIGMSSAALYHTMQHVLAEKRGTVFSTYMRSLRESWRYALPLGTGLAGGSAAVAYVSFLCCINEVGVLLMPAAMAALMLLYLLAVQIYLYPLIGHFVLTLPQLFSLVVRLTLLHPLRSVLLLLLFLCAALAAGLYPPLLLILPSGYAWLAGKLLTPAFFRYIRVTSSPAGPVAAENNELCRNTAEEV